MEIDDAMIDRFDKAAKVAGNTGENRLLYPPPDIRDVIRAGLEAALSPKPEPEIEVTEAMLEAGNEAWNKVTDASPSESKRHETYDKAMRAIYRAMVKAAPDGIPHAINSVTIK